MSLLSVYAVIRLIRLASARLEEMTAERGILVDHSTFYCWTIHQMSLLDKVFRHYKLPVGHQ